MTKQRFYEIKIKIAEMGLDMDDFYKSATNEEIAVDFVINNIQEFQGNIEMFVNRFDYNFRASNIDDLRINNIKTIIAKIVNF